MSEGAPGSSGTSASGPARSLADLLAEAGIQAAGRGGRRRRTEADPSPAEEATAPPPPVPRPARRHGTDSEDEPSEPEPSEPEPSEPEPLAPEPSEPEPVPDGAPPASPAVAARAVLGWLLFAVELVVAAILGVLIWYAFSLLWELYPYVAALSAPFVLTGLVIGGRVVRRRSGRRLGLSSLITLLLVGSLLVVLPAAAVLSGR
ncbi:MAG: hypothetical protein H0T66_10950 [Geodermatophilaceae bacterium]|nr:hypothetical protein [Geodermatophilaceae bacterium]